MSELPSIAVDLCCVTRDGPDVTLHFGQAVSSEVAPGAWQAVLLQRVAFSDGGAAKLQDLLVDLLRTEAAPGGPGR